MTVHERIKELKRLHEAGTPGKWYLAEEDGLIFSEYVGYRPLPVGKDGFENAEDTELVLATHNITPALLTVAEAAEKMREADEKLRSVQLAHTTLSRSTLPAVREARAKYDNAFDRLCAALRGLEEK